ncbi:MAG: 4-(cytidine 5'-diphospho)-2-C-methyl-D-erythritol kinase [Chryseosolibacter sp.]
MVSFPPCKINLGLHITGKRADGYHDIVTGFYPVPWNDVLEIVPARDFQFAMSGNPVPGAAVDNLCMRAYEMLNKQFRLKPVAMHLMKNIPIGAGLGGGSSDGAYALQMLNQIFNLSIPGNTLKDYALQLGSDCAFFLENRPMMGAGRGEILTPLSLSLSGKFLVIVKPEVQISTAKAYAGITPRTPVHGLRQILENHPVTEWRSLVKNDFEEVLFKEFPIIEAIHQKLYAFGATYASMSGSGSAVYGIFDKETDLQKEFPSMTYWSGVLD